MPFDSGTSMRSVFRVSSASWCTLRITHHCRVADLDLPSVAQDNWASSEELHHKHKSRVESLLYCKRKSNVLYSAGGSQSESYALPPSKSTWVCGR